MTRANSECARINYADAIEPSQRRGGGGDTILEKLKFMHKLISVSANINTEIPVDVSSLSAEQTDKWLANIDGNYFCKAFKAGCYCLNPGLLSSTANLGNGRYTAIYHYDLTGTHLGVYGFNDNYNNFKSLGMTPAMIWMNAGDNLRLMLNVPKNAVLSDPSWSFFTYLGNDASAW